MKHISIICLFLFSLLFASCDKEEKEPKTKSRVVMFYMVAENNLVSKTSNEDIHEILAAKSALNVDEEIVLYVDNNEEPAIYSITKNTIGTQLSELTPERQYTYDQNSCSGTSFAEFLSYVKANHPANEYAMVMWSHGSGWIPSTNTNDTQTFARRRSFGIDNCENTTSNEGRQMSITEMHSALQSFGIKLEYIFFDCCFMQCVEVDYELRDVAKYIIASPAEIPGPGADYATIVPSFFSKTTYATDIPSTYYLTYVEHDVHGCLLSSVDCSQLEHLASVTRQMTLKYKDTLINADYGNVLDYFQYDKYRWKGQLPDFYDMRGIFKTYLSTEDYTTWNQAFETAVPVSVSTDKWYSEFPVIDHTRYVDMEQYGGVSMYIPLQKYETDKYNYTANSVFFNGYWDSQWSKAVWDGKIVYNDSGTYTD